MTEIKFRVWDKHFGRWTEGALHPGALRHGIIMVPSTQVLMQSTGLKDRNGREIYEGDILGSWFGVGKSRQLLKHVVEFSVSTRTDTSGWLMPHPLSEFEVIGNIYENPELVS